jgi:multidrug efflux pump subunit AcrB
LEYLIAKASEILSPRPALKNSGTFTADDSLFGSDRMTRQPSMFDNPNIASFVSLEDIANVDDIQQKVQRIASAQNLQELMAIKQQHFYFEVQVHGQVKLSDVAEILYLGTQPSETIARLAIERGITIVVR